ncbi:hypothetical protein [Gracilibacillus kekensis]|uniref:Uncharacterized protein n=1 Tax=Gracilibacillus kekensis TaxID=1027249 RepID=A0A1M7IR23_9BACI|nr:hypothetical protein [Gracilibacillus kekensis]SHM42797.1 hypothetical protein SAMN05216179_0119 [Gracilibacillus kekensis]
MKNNFIKSIIIGTFAGFVLGLLLWWMEKITGEKVYTLLLNVDFIFQGIRLSLWIEWLFHLIISWLLVYIYLIMLQFCKTWFRRLLLILLLSFLAASSYIPLTILAIKETPALTNGIAIMLWTMGHLFYGISVFYFSNFLHVHK